MSMLIQRVRPTWRDFKPAKGVWLIGRYYGVAPTALLTEDGQEKHLRRDPWFEPLRDNGSRRDLAPGVLYRCPNDECGHQCYPRDMGADYAGEMWSNWICPACNHWHGVDDWEAISPL